MSTDDKRWKTETLAAVVADDLLAEAAQALQDWVTTYAPEYSGKDAVKAAWARIRERGGTIFYAAELSQRLQVAAGWALDWKADAVQLAAALRIPGGEYGPTQAQVDALAAHEALLLRDSSNTKCSHGEENPKA